MKSTLHPLSQTVLGAAILAFGSWMVWVNNTVALVEEDHQVIEQIREDIGEIKSNVLYLRGRFDQQNQEG